MEQGRGGKIGLYSEVLRKYSGPKTWRCGEPVPLKQDPLPSVSLSAGY